jgi:hypothetical protein
MVMTTRISAFLEASSGSSLNFNQSFSVGDAGQSKYFHPLEFILDPLTTVTGYLCNVTTAKYLLLETNLPIDVTIVTKIGPLEPPTATPATFRIRNVMAIGADITAPVIFYNPNGGASGNVSVKITAVGV